MFEWQKNGAVALTAAALVWAAPQPAQAVAPVAAVAVYELQNTLASSGAAAPALQAVDPMGVAGFGVANVLGNPQTVYNFGGNASPGTQQGGLSLDVSGLLAGKADFYSVEIVLRFNERDNAWRRILDVESRTTDNGFYVDPANNLDIYPVAGGTSFANGVFHDVFLVNNHGVVSFYLDNSSATVVTTPVMNIDSNMRLNFFLDNLQGGGQGEYSSGSVALIRVYDQALAAPPPPVPEPATAWLMLAGLGSVVWGHGLARARRVARPQNPCAAA